MPPEALRRAPCQTRNSANAPLFLGCREVARAGQGSAAAVILQPFAWARFITHTQHHRAWDGVREAMPRPALRQLMPAPQG